jgi:hypothetical protein
MAKKKLTPIMGKGAGVKELEHCPSVWHVELTPKELAQLIQDPVGTSQVLGFKERIRAVHIVLPDRPMMARARYC